MPVLPSDAVAVTVEDWAVVMVDGLADNDRDGVGGDPAEPYALSASTLPYP